MTAPALTVAESLKMANDTLQFESGVSNGAGVLTGTETIAISRGNGLLQTTASALATLTLSAIAPQRQSIPVLTAGQAAYVTQGYSVGVVNVFVAGIRLNPAQYQALDGTNVVITDANVLASLVVGMTVDIDGAVSIAVAGVATPASVAALIPTNQPASNPLTGTELFSISQGSGLFQSSLTKIATWVIQTFQGFIRTGTGAVARTVLARMLDLPISAKDFGVVGNGVADDTAALQAAIASLPVTGGVIDCSMCPVIKVSSTILIGNGTTTAGSTNNNVFLRGGGGGGPFSTSAGTRILWAGAAGGTIMEFMGGMTGGGLDGGWVLDGGGIAATGLIVNHLEGGQFPRLKIMRCTGVYLSLTAQTNPDPVGSCRNNRFGVYTTDTLPSGATGMLLDGPTTLPSILQNTFDVVDIPMSGAGAIGMQLGYCDFNDFRVVDISAQTTLTTSIGIKLVGTGPSGSAIFPSMNHFGQLASDGPIQSITTGGRPYGNMIDVFDIADSNQTIPTAMGVMGYAQNILGATANQQTIKFGFINPGWDTSTPAVPTATGSANKVTNTNTYPVQIFQSVSGSAAPTGQHIIDYHATDNPINVGVTSFILGPGESVYYTGNLPTNWIWFGMS